MPSKLDPLVHLRSLDPAVTFRDGDDSAAAGEMLRRIISEGRPSEERLTRGSSVHRLAAIAAALVIIGLVLPALAIGTSVFHLLADEPAPPVNGLIAARGVGAIYLIDPKSRGVLKVQGTAMMDEPAWSPDGKLLAVEQTEKGASGVYTVWPNGTHPQLILKNASAPVWSADGTRIFVQRDTCNAPGGCEESDDETTVVFSVAPDGTDAHQISEEDAFDVSEAGWPPETNVLSFLEDEGSSATSGPTTLDSSTATFSPDGTMLAFADADTGIWVVSDGGEPELLVKGTYTSLSWGTAVNTPAEGSALVRYGTRP
jgi:WD40-like Beta Propeller Repeat